MPDPTQEELVRELNRRRATLTPDQAAMVDELMRRMSPAPTAQPPKGITDLPGNIVTSGGKLAGETIQAFTHPVETLSGMGNMALGIAQGMSRAGTSHLQYPRALGQVYGERYGSVDKALNTLYTDPVGVLSDLSLVAGGTGLIAKGAQMGARAANLSRTANAAGLVNRVLKTTAAVTDPVNIVVKPVTGTLSAIGRRGGALNPVQRAAIDYGMQSGINVPAATATGNKFVKVLQAGLEHTPGGSLVADAEKTKIANQMAAEGRRLASQIDPNAVVPETAGAGVRSALSQSVEASASRADQAYDIVRQVEADPKHTRNVQTGTKVEEVIDPNTFLPSQRTVPVMEKVALPVEVGSLKKLIRPVYEQMQWWEPARRNASAEYQALKKIIEGPDVVPASVAELGLGGLKQLAREGDARNAGLAKMIIPELQKTIDDTVHAADPKALQALQEGRANTAVQYTTKEVLDKLRKEPVQA